MEQNLLVNPVMKTVFVDETPKELVLIRSNISALSEYSDLNESTQQFYAVEKTVFYELKKNSRIKNPNRQEGAVAIEVWKYNPELLIGELLSSASVVDPLSLYLSVQDKKDERIEMALEQILEIYI